MEPKTGSSRRERKYFLGVKLNLFSDLLKLKNKKLVGRDVLSFQVYILRLFDSSPLVKICN